MFSFKKKMMSPNCEHSTKRRDWENVLDELYLQVVHYSKNGVAVVSNTVSDHEKTDRGSDQLSFRMKKVLPLHLRESIRQLNHQQFVRLFATKSKAEPVLFDCYELKSFGLSNNVLVYFIAQDHKKAMLVFTLPIIPHDLGRLIETTNQILRGVPFYNFDPSELLFT